MTGTVGARVREWHDAEGWGVLDSAETPGGCWAHYSDIAPASGNDGFRSLTPGQPVILEWEAGAQDGYAYRARRVVPGSSPPATGSA
ncbi:cold shock domain-containing protein [Streptomyces sp. 7-21]|jgi:CspA family cold shock protein|uniref:cold shock domain-containing protein n=1 Tax=Streptomyces sp. 7-21 TaxID=2802283 RepID=UPI001F3E611A|nr:cold shock domain-containing protein [Streptomyces sp. 7-21]